MLPSLNKDKLHYGFEVHRLLLSLLIRIRYITLLPWVMTINIKSLFNAFLAELFKTKCMPILLYGLDACSVGRPTGQVRSFNHVLVFCGRKIFDINSSETAAQCLKMFRVIDVAEVVATRKDRFVFFLFYIILYTYIVLPISVNKDVCDRWFTCVKNFIKVY